MSAGGSESRGPGRVGAWLRAVAAAALLLLLAGCGVPYLLRAGYEEARILWGREPIGELLARPDLPAGEREHLELVLALTSFATQELGLPAERSYRTVAPAGSPGTVFVVGAAYRDRLEPYTWWYPLLGRLPYRGFFGRARAERAAAKLARRGLDTVVRPAVAFSTLGWFEDPLPRVLLEAQPVVLAEVVIHELFHGLVYLPGEATFDESAANFVGHRGAVAFFCRPVLGAGPAAESSAAGTRRTVRVAAGVGVPHHSRRCAAARRRWSEELARARVLAALARELRALYVRRPAAAALAAGRARVFAAGRQELGALGPAGAALAAQPLNNAVVLQELLYTTHLDLFEELYDAKCRDLRRTIDLVAVTTRGRRRPFARLRSLVVEATRRARRAPCARGEGRVPGAAVRVGLSPAAAPRYTFGRDQSHRRR